MFRYRHNTKLTIPVAWLNDGITDCLSGVDESNTIWPTCKLSSKYRPVPNNTTCKNVFLCKQGSLDFVELDLLCDGREDCGAERSVCMASRLTPKLFVSPPSSQGLTFMFYCLPGLKTMERLTDPCIEDTFISSDQPLFGLGKLPKLKTPDVIVNCGNVFGELYVYLSCLNRCANYSCILTPLSHDSCPKDYHEKVFTLAKDGYLTFVVKHREEYHNRFFLCKNKKCVNLDKVCNLANDCGDGSDETNCTNHFQCITSKFYIPHVKKCDGNIDCMDYSDECNQECNKEIIAGAGLKALAWAIGGTAFCLNFVCLWNAIREPWADRKSALVNRTFKILINFGDMMTGLYLLLIALVDSAFYRGNYCQNQLTWLTSEACAFLGMLNIIGANISLFSMTFLSVFRVVSIKLNGAECIERVEFKMIVIVIIIILASMAIACTPLFSTLVDFYVNGMAYDRYMGLFIGVANKKNHLDVIDAYYGKISQRKISWKEIEGLLNLMFTDDYGKINRKKVHFYGNEGVCLFKYFVKRNDPQRYYVWMILTVDFMCFVVISMSYLLIITGAKRSSNNVKQMMPKINSKNLDFQTARLQHRITQIVVTDLCCWIPFIGICVLHSLEVIDATFLYSISSVVILPINSVFNPLMYDNFIIGRLSCVKQFIGSKLSIFFLKLKIKAYLTYE